MVDTLLLLRVGASCGMDKSIIYMLGKIIGKMKFTVYHISVITYILDGGNMMNKPYICAAVLETIAFFIL